MKYLTIVAAVTFMAGSANADGPLDFTTHSPVPIGLNAEDGVIVGIEAHKLGDIVRYLPVSYDRSDWTQPSRRLGAYLVSPSRGSFKERFATIRRDAERHFEKIGATQAPDLIDRHGRFQSFMEGLTVYLDGERIVADTGGYYSDEKQILFSGVSDLNKSCEAGSHQNRLLNVSVIPELGVLAAYVESACDTPKGVNYRRRLIIAEIPALMERLAAFDAR
ncbi:MAG: hypothetical protein ACI9OJ_003366 [Myxococcota bacterium]|jgi:hypothetical protein